MQGTILVQAVFGEESIASKQKIQNKLPEDPEPHTQNIKYHKNGSANKL